MAGDTPAEFNMAIASLQRLDTLLQDYKKASCSIDPRNEKVIDSPVARIKLKDELVKQFQINAEPLLNEDQQKEVREIMDKIPALTKVEWTKPKYGDGRWVEVVLKDSDKILNDVLMHIERLLQSQHYFMPPKKDAGKAIMNM